MNLKIKPQHCKVRTFIVLQAVEFFAEWSLSPTNVVFLRVQTGVYDPLLIGDKSKWFCQGLQKIDFPVCDDPASTLGAAVSTSLQQDTNSDDIPTGKAMAPPYLSSKARVQVYLV